MIKIKSSDLFVKDNFQYFPFQIKNEILNSNYYSMMQGAGEEEKQAVQKSSIF